MAGNYEKDSMIRRLLHAKGCKKASYTGLPIAFIFEDDKRLALRNKMYKYCEDNKGD